ncbi:MAG: bifunctional riboflavin kinase/FAD synthetase [Lewinella sp.]|nr:bifunctional riboflavin kinase/FAD synthetase [Lewinella sp.]
MRVFYELDQLPAFQNAVITIGSFDGVHRGHQQLLARINRLARRCEGESVVITFHPHPRQVIYPQDDSLRLLTTIEEKVELFGRYGVDNVVVVPFTVEFSQLSADEYIKAFLIDRFAPRFIVIGYDHRFGLNRQGNIEYLKWYSQQAGYEVVEIPPQEVDDMAVSSSKIRRALEAGQVAAAHRWLGHPFSLTGKVVYGQQIGSKMGFPTANIKVGEKLKLLPPDGIYAVRVRYGEKTWDGMLYIGRRPSIADQNKRSIEVNIFDFNQDIYGETLSIEFLDYIRGDETFPTLDDLREQLARDREDVRNRLRELPSVDEPSPGTQQTAIVILNFNGADFLRKFLPEVVRTAKAAGCTVVVADNGSTDDSLAMMRAEFPDLTILDLGSNFGFAEGYNRALANIDADYYVLLNSDVRVTDDWLTPCLERLAAEPGLAACQPKILSQEDPECFEYAGAAGGWLDALGYPFCRGRIFATTEKDEGQYDDPDPIFWASGAALFIKADLFHRIGGFDGDYFAHAEEIDLCWRLKRAGYRIEACPSAVVYHYGGGTLAYQNPRKTYLNFHNTLVTGFKNEPLGKLPWWLLARLLLDGLAGCLFLVQGKWAHIWSIIRAHWHFFPRLGYWWRRRQDYDRRIKALTIGPSTEREGVYPGSIVWAYYGRGRRHFGEIVKADDNG